MQRFHGTAARQLVLIGDRPETAAMFTPRPAPPRIRLMQKDLYAELTRRRRHAQIAARRLLRSSEVPTP
ncbi:MAG: hypothetical protein FJW21_09265 [Acidimicrobiia bacterium]|nr:hypothetical protein [Acidimicrobiia bacterium]